MKKQHSNIAFKGILSRFRRNRDGIAAVEFALVVPILLAMYLGTLEVSSGITVNKRVARVASTVADLVTQQSAVTKSNLDSILDIGAAIMFPYTADKPAITITAIDVDDDHPNGGEIIWARRYNKGTYDNGGSANAPGTKTDVPPLLRVDETFIIKVVTEIEYRPIVTWVIGQKTDGAGNTYTALDMGEEYWLRPRVSAEVDCTDC